jgi:hypothetical protein
VIDVVPPVIDEVPGPVVTEPVPQTPVEIADVIVPSLSTTPTSSIETSAPGNEAGNAPAVLIKAQTTVNESAPDMAALPGLITGARAANPASSQVSFIAAAPAAASLGTVSLQSRIVRALDLVAADAGGSEGDKAFVESAGAPASEAAAAARSAGMTAGGQSRSGERFDWPSASLPALFIAMFALDCAALVVAAEASARNHKPLFVPLPG